MPKSLFALLLHIGYADAKLKCTNICLEIILCWQKLKATCRPSSIQQVCFCWEGSRAVGGELKVFKVNAERNSEMFRRIPWMRVCVVFNASLKESGKSDMYISTATSVT